MTKLRSFNGVVGYVTKDESKDATYRLTTPHGSILEFGFVWLNKMKPLTVDQRRKAAEMLFVIRRNNPRRNHQMKEMTLEEKYQEALDALQVLLNVYGVKSPLWEKPRNILDRERPILKEEVK